MGRQCGDREQLETLMADYSAVFPYSKTREKHRLLLGSGL